MADNNGATAENTAGQVIGSVSQAVGAIPLIGPIASGIGSLISGVLERNAAQKQAQQAQNARQAALNTPLENQRPEYLAALHMARMRELSGLPGAPQDKQDLSQQLADQLRAIRMRGKNGGQKLQAHTDVVSL